jgi:hypothetical protein
MLVGTFVEPDLDVDGLNAQWLEVSRSVDVETAKAELVSSRARMLSALAALPEVTSQAQEWFEESGDLHYLEHLPELRMALRGHAGAITDQGLRRP